MRTTILTVLFLAAVFAIAEDEPKPKPPAVSLEFKAEFFKAQSQAQAAQMALEQTAQFKESQDKQKAFQAAVVKLQKLCGDKFQAGLDQSGDPYCTAKPEPPKPAETEKKK